MTRIYQCLPNEFDEYTEELNNYVRAQATGVVVTNAERLINLVKGYYKALLYYSEHSVETNIVTISGNKRRIEVGARDQDGNLILPCVLS